jgi:two-component system, cell cycle response regulator DivK
MENRRNWNIVEKNTVHRDINKSQSIGPYEVGIMKNILVAEDEEFNRIFLGELLSDTNSKIYWALDGLQAVEYFKKYDFDLILMDIKMPRLGGIEATRQIRSMNSDVPIIAQTAFAMEDEEMKYKDQGFNDFIKKPINISEFIEKVDYWLNIKDINNNLRQF